MSTLNKVIQKLDLSPLFQRLIDYFSDRWSTWAKYILVTGSLLGAAALGFLAGKRDPKYALLAASLPFLAFGGELVLRYQFLQPIILLLLSTITSYYVSKGITFSLVLAAGFSGLWLIVQATKRKTIRIIPESVAVPTLIWIIVSTISLIWGRVMADPILIEWPDIELIQLAQLAVIILSPVAMLLTANTLTKPEHLKWLVGGYLLVTTYGILAEFINILPNLNLRGLNSTWVVGILYGLLLFHRKLSPLNKLLIIILISVWLGRYLIQGITWLSGWLPIVITMVAITFLRSRKIFFLLVILIVIIVAIGFPWWQSVYQQEYNESGGNRMDKWEFLFRQPFVWGHMLLGTGPFGYARYFMTYFPENAASTHNNYIDIFLQTGIIGSLVFIWLIWAIAQKWWLLYKAQNQDAFLRSYIVASLGGLISILVAMVLGDWFIPFVLNQGLHGYSWTVMNWIFLGGMLSITQYSTESSPSQS